MHMKSFEEYKEELDEHGRINSITMGAVSYYQFTLVNYIGFHDRGMLLAGGCGDTNGRPQIGKTDYLRHAYEFGQL